MPQPTPIRLLELRDRILAAIENSADVNTPVDDLLEKTLLPPWQSSGDPRAEEIEQRMAIRWPAFRRYLEVLRTSGAIETALTHAVDEDEPARIADIRAFYLDPQESYSLAELAAVWRIPLDDVRAIYADDLRDAGEAPLRVEWADAVGAATRFSILRPFDIERALGADYERVRSAAWRTTPVLVHVPRWVLAAMSSDAMTPPNLSPAAGVERLLLDLYEHAEDAAR